MPKRLNGCAEGHSPFAGSTDNSLVSDFYWSLLIGSQITNGLRLLKKTVPECGAVASFYPIILRVSGIREGRPFRGNYRLVFDKNSLTYLAPNNMPDEIKPYPFIALSEPGTLSLACKGTVGSDKKRDPVSMGIVVNFTTRTVQFGLYRYPEKIKITGPDDARVVFGEESEGSGFIGTINRVTGDTQAKAVGGDAYSLQCRPVQ